MKTKEFCPECDQMLDALTAITRQLFDVCSKIAVVVEKEGRTDSPSLDLLLAQTRTLMSECATTRQSFQDHRASGHSVSSSFAVSHR